MNETCTKYDYKFMHKSVKALPWSWDGNFVTIIVWLRSRVLVLLHQDNKNIGYTNHNAFKKRSIHDHRCIFAISRIHFRIVYLNLTIETCPFVKKIYKIDDNVQPEYLFTYLSIYGRYHVWYLIYTNFFNSKIFASIVDKAFSSPRDETITHGTLASIKTNEAKV